MLTSPVVTLMEVNGRRWSGWFFKASTAGILRCSIRQSALASRARGTTSGYLWVIDVTMSEHGGHVSDTARCFGRSNNLSGQHHDGFSGYHDSPCFRTNEDRHDDQVRPDGQWQDLHHDGTSQAPGGLGLC